MINKQRTVILVVLDGFGLREAREDNAVALAKMPRFRELWERYPHTSLGASGLDVGLPEGLMGNSEVGHLNLGAGRIAQMDISRIDCAVADHSLGKNPEIAAALAHAKAHGGRLHLLGLVSDGGVHSSLDHLVALITAAHAEGVPLVLHAFLDGRDTPPRSAKKYIAVVEDVLAGKGMIGTVSGRFWAMDRDKRWERVQRAYDAIVSAAAPRHGTALEAIEAAYTEGKSDEFVEPVTVGDYHGVAPGKDSALFFNFRPDRARELSRALTQPDFQEFPRPEGRATPFGIYVCMTRYDASLPLPVAFPPITHPDMFGELVSKAGMAQFRCAETEKFPHVTFFFNGGREEPFEGEDRKLIPSPKEVPTYDLKPEMSAAPVARAVVDALESERYQFILVNFANPDMVGHTGNLQAAIRALEAVDQGLGAIVDTAIAQDAILLLTADHGNCELMRDPVTGGPHTAHTTNPVPFVYVDPRASGTQLREGGRLCDVAPTMLQLLELPHPEAMTGKSLLLPR
ncbi:MAG: 2,3-bisphosphoglycerate-independent phosphoglycerate mutase [Myxococcales bacterium]|nr:2,3-bisphosphoglycerate-independent phosphoglycerate mutase [Polyangiaceae bacterium]MDW8248229.1 2,3-bisphosphoglycerate-independent phosphoglycerate mutase [Myxococcales bacterium]